MYDTRLSKVQSGLGLIYAGLCLKVLAVILAFLAVYFFANNPGPGIVQAIRGLVILALFADLLSFLGMILCLGAPGDMPGRGLILVSFLLQLVTLLAQAVPTYNALMLMLGNFGGIIVLDMPKEIENYSRLIGLLAFVVFLLFLNQLGKYVQREDLAAKAIGVLLLGAFIILLLIATFVLLYTNVGRRNINPDTFLTIIMVDMVVVFSLIAIFVIRYGNLLSSLRTACGERLRPEG